MDRCTMKINMAHSYLKLGYRSIRIYKTRLKNILLIELPSFCFNDEKEKRESRIDA